MTYRSNDIRKMMQRFSLIKTISITLNVPAEHPIQLTKCVTPLKQRINNVISRLRNKIKSCYFCYFFIGNQ
ncbi:hypothetical protein HMPREF0454_04180 [Hafnia alvei ATCC 51873]|uniref:Uncharacterized protein n=1 Tax=Hafnia alvei ATCC 51873 TaxID=1002364 RepID=G9YC54_HAFAL|nr:hypothetical protein HMPREF0454_04180 [Hafnia alvei ATCC 51873]